MSVFEDCQLEPSRNLSLIDFLWLSDLSLRSCLRDGFLVFALFTCELTLRDGIVLLEDFDYVRFVRLLGRLIRSGPLMVNVVNVRALSQQVLNNVGLVALDSIVNRGLLVVVNKVRVGSKTHEFLDSLKMAFSRRIENWAFSIGINVVYVAVSLSHQEGDKMVLSFTGSVVQCCLV